MWRNYLILILFVFLLTGCVQYDVNTLTLSLKPGIDTVEVNSSFTDAGARATLGGLEYKVNIIETTVDITKVGTYHITYETTYQTVTKQLTRFVNVVDETPPIITLNPGIDTILKDGVWEDAGVVVSDNSQLEVTTTIEGNVITSIPGEYHITYIATDSYGNQSEVVRYVNILD